MSKFGFVGMTMEYALEELFDLQMGKTPSRNNPEYWNSGVHKWISIGDLSKCGKYIFETKEYLSDKAVSESGISLIPADTVVMSFKLSIGKTAITPEPMYSNEAIMSFRDRHIVDILPDYIYYMFSGKDWDAGTNKAVMGKTLNKATLSKIKVRIHSISDQQEIVRVLDKVKGIIDAREQELQALDNLIKARFVEMFGEPIRNTQNRKTTEFINVVKMQRGFDLPVQERRQDGGIPVYGSNGALDHHNVAKVQGGGVITGRSGTIGKVFYTECDYWPLNTSLFSVDTHCNNVIYLAYLIEMFDLSRFVEGTGVPTLNRNMFHNKQIIDVELTEQNQFATFVRQVDKSKVVVQNHSKICYNRTIFTNRTLWHKESASREKKYDN